MNLVRVGAITGVIRNEDGTPAISVRVMAVPPSSVDSIACDIRLPVHGAEIALDGREFALSDEHGRFRFHDVRRKRSHILEVSAPGYASSRTNWKSEAGEPRIVLDRVQEVTFQVIDQADQPVGGASVEILDPDGRANLPIRWPWHGGLSGEHLARTDVDGFVRLGLRPGRVFLEVRVDSSTETTCFELLSTPLPTTISRLRLP